MPFGENGSGSTGAVIALGVLAVGAMAAGLYATHRRTFVLVVGPNGKVQKLGEDEAQALMERGKACIIEPERDGSLTRICKRGGRKYKPKSAKAVESQMSGPGEIWSFT